MLNISDFKEVIDASVLPVVIGKAVYKDNDISDFNIDYINNSFSENYGDFIQTGSNFNDLKKNLTDEINWIELCRRAAAEDSHSAFSKTFYSAKFEKFLKVITTTSDSKLFSFWVLDVSTDKQHEDQLKHYAFYDGLTDLYNNAKLREDLKEFCKISAKTGEKFGVLLIDLDNMKFVNDSQGHTAGDQIICNAADILKRFNRDTITSYRFGGDEFVVVAKNISSKNTMLNIGDAILESFNAEGIEFSAGITVCPDDTTESEALLKYADMAMYQVKKESRNNISFFQNIMQETFMNRVTIQNKISDALINNNFQLYYQPQFDISTNSLRGFEALVRWQDETLGWINPDQFISIAEETRLVIPLGEWVMNTALHTLEEWVSKYNFGGVMSVNVSPVQLKKPDFLFNLKKSLSSVNVDPHHLEIEITEGVLIDNKDEVIKLLNAIREMGIGISLDDFGTGYSSLNYLQMLPITTLKIDKSFVANITSDNGVEANITDSIVSMVTKMGLDTIAEGVEKPDQLKVLKKINCKTVQGFLKGKPMSKERCDKMLAGNPDAILTIENDI